MNVLQDLNIFLTFLVLSATWMIILVVPSHFLNSASQLFNKLAGATINTFLAREEPATGL
jgi:hypothetical protein